MMVDKYDRAADLVACIGDVLFAGARLARAVEAGVLAYADFDRSLSELEDDDES